MDPITLLIILLLVFLVFGFPAWPHSANWGWGPSGIAGVLLVVLLVLLLAGKI